MSPEQSKNYEERLTRVETNVANLVDKLDNFFDEFRTHQAERNQEFTRIWQAIDKAVHGRALNLPQMASVGGFFLALILAAAAINNHILSIRLDNVALRTDHNKELMDLKVQNAKDLSSTRAFYLEKLANETHEQLQKKQP